MIIAVILSCKKSLYDRQGPIYKIGVYTPKGGLENRPPGFRIRPVHNDLTKDSTSRNFVDTEVNTQLHSATRVLYIAWPIQAFIHVRLCYESMKVHFLCLLVIFLC